MREIRTLRSMSGDGKRGSATAPVLELYVRPDEGRSSNPKIAAGVSGWRSATTPKGARASFTA